MNLIFTNSAKKDLAALDKTTQKRIKEALGKIMVNPQAVDLKKLQGSPGKWRLRVGNWRIILEANPEKGLLYVLRVRHRREAYR